MSQPSPFDLSGKVAIVTGAARGIGAAIAEAFVQQGIRHVLRCDILEMTFRPTGQMSGASLDVTSEASWQSVVADAVQRIGAPDILVNNAGIFTFGTIDELAVEDFRRMLDVNVTGTLLGMQAVIPHMKAMGRGSIINISSASGMLPSNFISGYAAGKFAVRGLTRGAALELGLQGIRVNSVHPGGVNTPMTNPLGASQEEVDKSYHFVPMQRGSTAEEIANGVVYLASDASAYCNGTELTIDGGMTAGVYFPGMPGSPTASTD